jgi:hypothetical protein
MPRGGESKKGERGIEVSRTHSSCVLGRLGFLFISSAGWDGGGRGYENVKVMTSFLVFLAGYASHAGKQKGNDDRREVFLLKEASDESN